MPFRPLNRSVWLVVLAVCSCASLRAQTTDDSLRMAANSFMRKWVTKDIAIRPSITFQHQVSFVSKEFSWKGEQNEVIHLKFNDGSGIIGVGSERELEGGHLELFIVCDEPALATVNFMHADTLDLAVLFLFPDFFKDKKRKKVKFDRTDSTLTIAGMPATKWVSNTEKETIELWVAPMKGLRPVAKAWGKLHGQPQVADGDYEEGLVLKARMKYNEGTETHTQFEATEIKLNTPYTFSSEGYAVQ